MNSKLRIIMMKLKPYAVILSVVLTMASCRFSEECNYTGNVQLTMDWESMWGNLQKPESLNALFYRNGKLSAKRELLGDTIYENIPSGDTDMIIFNQPVGMESTGLEVHSDAELHLPTYFVGNIRTVDECSMICSFNNHLIVPIENIVQQTVTPLPIVKQLVFIVHIVKEGAMGDITSCEASLSGIPTGYSLSRQEEIRSKATVFFPLQKNVNKEGEEYEHQFFVLGVNSSKQGEEDIAKKLSINVTLDDGESRSEDVDITAELDRFTANVFKCEVTVTITAMSANVEITSWGQGAWDQIVIQ